MKQILLILSMVLAAFVAACSDTNHTTKIIRGSQGGQKTLEQLEKASSDKELLALKAQLEKKSDLQLSDVIAAVKSRFGKRAAVARPKEQPKKDKKGMVIQQDPVGPAIEDKPQAAPSNTELDLLPLEYTNKVVVDKNIQRVCIKSCDMEVVVVSTRDAQGQLTAVQASVVTWIFDENAKIVNSKLKNKSFKSIQATYDVTSENMNLKLILATKDSELILVSNYNYNEKEFSETNFIESEGIDSGTLQLMTGVAKKVLIVQFATEGDILNIQLNNDLGLFGKNITEQNGFEQR